MELNNNMFSTRPLSKGKKITEYIYVIVSLLLLVAAGYSRNGSLMTLFIAFLLVPINKPILLLPVLFASTVTSNIFVASNDIHLSFSRIVTVIFIVYTLVYFFIKKKYSLENFKKIGVWFLIIITSFLISTLLSETFSFTELFIVALNMFLFYLMALYILFEEDKRNLMNFMIISSVIIGITLIYMLSFGEIIIVLDERLTLEGVNANRLAMSMIQVIGIYLFTIVILRFKINSIFFVGIIILSTGLFYLLLQTGSRTSVLAIVFALVVIIALFYTGIQRRNLFFGMIAIGIIVTVFSEFITTQFGFFGVYQRYAIDSMLESRGTHRIDNWLLIFEHVIPQNIFFGVGLGAENIKEALGGHNFMTKNAAHNIVIDPLAQTGIFGLIAFWYMVIYVLKKTVSFFRAGYLLIGLPLMLFLVSLFNGIGESMYTTRFIWFAMGLCMMFLPIKKNKTFV